MQDEIYFLESSTCQSGNFEGGHMKGLIIPVIAGILFGLFLAAGCDNKDNPASVQTNNAIGTWTYTSGDTTKTLVITADKFTLNISGGYPMHETGTYVIKGDTIYYTFTLCEGGDSPMVGIPCPQQNTGIITTGSITIPDAFGGINTLTKQP
jgi:hypothetical protein